MYRENLYGIIENTGQKISKIIVPKNSGLKGYAWQVLREAGVNLDEAEQIGRGELRLNGITYILRRGEDIPKSVEMYAENGQIVLGITGDDLLDEHRLRNPGSFLKVENTYDWHDEKARYLRPTLCLINVTGNADDIPLEGRIALNDKYRETSRQYLAKSPRISGKNLKMDIYTGDIESNVPEFADCAIDTVYGGKTIDGLGLKVAEKIRFSDLVVISPLSQEESDIGRAVRKEFELIRAQLQNPTGNYAFLLQDDGQAMGKLNEEVLNLLEAYKERDGDFAQNLADVVSAATLLAVKKGCTADEVAGKMFSRQNRR